MSTKSGIVWTEFTWSPVTGCTKVSAGCKNCYAEREVESRWSKNPKSVFYGRAFSDVRCHPDSLGQPLHWKKPRKIFVCPRGDLFHPDVPFEFIDRVFAVMALCPQHIFQVLTKRPERMLRYFTHHFTRSKCATAATAFSGMKDSVGGGDIRVSNGAFPMPNVWVGVSVEDQATADERIPLLLEIPAAVRWLSMEPLLECVDLLLVDCMGAPDRAIDWIVVGGESGASARPMHPDWVRDIQDQCQFAKVPFLFKQWGEWSPWQQLLATTYNIMARSTEYVFPDGVKVERFGNKITGNLLDGYECLQYPEVKA